MWKLARHRWRIVESRLRVQSGRAQTEVANELLRTLDIKNAIDILVLFDRYDVHELKEGLIRFVIVNRKKLFGDDDKAKRFKEANPRLSVEVFEKYFFDFDKGVTDLFEDTVPVDFKE